MLGLGNLAGRPAFSFRFVSACRGDFMCRFEALKYAIAELGNVGDRLGLLELADHEQR